MTSDEPMQIEQEKSIGSVNGSRTKPEEHDDISITNPWKEMEHSADTNLTKRSKEKEHSTDFKEADQTFTNARATPGDSDTDPSDVEEEVLERRPTRARTMPERFKDYFLGMYAYVSSSGDTLIPKTHKEAMNSPDWAKWSQAIQSELDSLERNKTWKLVPKPPGNVNVIDNKWIFDLKRDQHGNIIRYKARLCAKGYTQIEGLDYKDTFSPVVRMTTIRLLLYMANSRQMIIKQSDAETAFLNGVLDEIIYMRQPHGHEERGMEDHVCLMLKSLYGLKQSSKQWYKILLEVLKKIGFIKFNCDDCAFRLIRGTETAYLLVFVDDFIITSTSRELAEHIQTRLSSTFKMKDMGDIKYFLGMEIQRNIDLKTLWIGQPQYIKDTLESFQMQDCKPIATPEEVHLHLPRHTGDQHGVDASQYRKLIGKLMYLALSTRPDIAHICCYLSRFLEYPGTEHWKAGKRVLRYLKGTQNHGIMFTSKGQQKLIGYSDSDYAGDIEDRKSTGGYVFMLDGAISWMSKKQSSVAQSTMEAEYYALAEAVKEAIWLRNLSKEMDYEQEEATLIYEDNQGTIKFTSNSIEPGRTKHIDVRYHFVRDNREKNIVKFEYKDTKNMIADILTKGLPKEQFVKLRTMMKIEEAPNTIHKEEVL
jgi:hypothetical protein